MVRFAQELDRRAVLAGATAVSATALLPGSARAQGSPHRFKVGEAEITILSDGSMQLPPALMLPGRDAAAIEKAFSTAGQKFTGFLSQVNVAIVRIGQETILIDAGAGPDFMPSLGKLNEHMEAAGIKPETITKFVLTHCHADHLWGLIDPLTSDTYFEKAEHVVSGAERDHWLQADIGTRVPEAFRGMAVGTHRRMKALAERLKPVKAGTEVVAGVQLVDTAGHTPGHVSVLVRSGGAQLLIGGDVLTQHVISFAEPDWQWGPDMDATKAAASRRRTLDQLATDRVQLLGYHLPWPGRGFVEKKDNAYRFVPAI